MLVYTGGTFDGLHVGHLELLEDCRRLAGPNGKVVVALNRDEFIQRFKGHPPVHPYRQRWLLLAMCSCVDLVVCNIGDEDSSIAIEVIQPGAIVIGDDWKDRDYLSQLGISEDWLSERQIELVYSERTTGVSSSGIVERIRKS